MRRVPPVPDVFDPRQYGDAVPYAAYRVPRDHHPVAWQEEPEVLGRPAGPGFWAVTRHADVVRVLKDSTTYSSHLGATQIRDPDPADLPFIRRMMLNQDPPDHGRLRRTVARAFTPGRIDRFAAVAEQRARALFTAALETARADDGTVDLVSAVTDDYALLNLTDLLGVPDSDRELLLRWTRRVIGYQDPDEAGPQVLDGDGKPVDPRSPAMPADMFGYARQPAAYKKEHPADDVLTTLAHDTELADGALEMFFFLLTVAGNDTVRSATPGGLLALAEHPAAYRWLRADSGRLPTRSTSCCAGTRRSSPSDERPYTTPGRPDSTSARATRWSSSTPPPTVTSGRLRRPTRWTCPAHRIRTCPSATARTSASEPSPRGGAPSTAPAAGLLPGGPARAARAAARGQARTARSELHQRDQVPAGPHDMRT